MKWEPVIGIEAHVELKTASKMFCGCSVTFGEEPNTNVCPTCLGLPGALPVPNSRALEAITQIGLALHCQIAPQSVFHRKNYFYADLPKNYQVSQFDSPIAIDGWLEIDVESVTERIRIERAHMEEDTGKSLHQGDGGRIHSATATWLDFNRSGVPLVEIVSRPDLRSAAAARTYAQDLRSVVAELDVSDARMEEGSIRFDANVSVRPQGEEGLGTKVEIKNMNSFRSLERAIASEIARQIEVLGSGGTVSQETRHWDEQLGATHSMRTKEGSSDYRYFAEPDLLPLRFERETIERLRSGLPELPAERRHRFEAMGVDASTARTLAGADPELRQVFTDAIAEGAEPGTTAHWITGEVTAAIRKSPAFRIDGARLAELLTMIDDGKLSSSGAKSVLSELGVTSAGAATVAARLDVLQVSDTATIESAVREVLAAQPESANRYRAGEEKVLGFLVGQVMKATGGKADPKLVNEILRRELA